ncbi:META domain-containing protein [Candidatus Thiothrix anitrata]|jgi:heat shock protein HslJ|uniref:META domain-containing protein n=1 Tax=Candidatus Thiothrix anitrata TaxID=2823902 RepID=A0ABX7X7V6_9GAMM|nr:META domain-containing protein [Candidatus Thiothrix anitrata]QTR51348.1 META domain-containing protein [Candidatus Thiothrix anitrata]
MVKNFLTSLVGQLLLVLLGLAVISACSLEANTKPHATLNLNGTQWHLKTLKGATLKTERPLSISFDSNRMSGYSGCNSFFGSYTASSDGVFGTGAIGATKMACIGERDQLERDYLDRLAQASTYTASRDQLQLLDAQRKVLLSFVSAPATKRL